MTDQDRRQQILEGALHVFSEQGYHKASIKEIAKAAGIKSSALIYHYFADKKAVLGAIIQELTPFAEVPIFRDEPREEDFATLPDILLPRVGKRVLSMIDNQLIMATIRIFISEAARMNEVGDAVSDIQKKGLMFFSRYLEYHIKTGYLRPHDTAASSRAFIGMMLAYVLGQTIFSGVREGMPAREVYVDEAVRLFVEGLRNRE
jgi:TetR/AcrR family transcriptional regulator, mexJK operon transcriptional repressor